jgi:hypothetical protein
MTMEENNFFKFKLICLRRKSQEIFESRFVEGLSSGRAQFLDQFSLSYASLQI